MCPCATHETNARVYFHDQDELWLSVPGPGLFRIHDFEAHPKKDSNKFTYRWQHTASAVGSDAEEEGGGGGC